MHGSEDAAPRSEEALLHAIDKRAARLTDTEMQAAYAQALDGAERSFVEALSEAIFDVFRERGESSDDVAEGAGVSVPAAMHGERAAVRALLAYACTSAGLLREATVLMIERRPALAAALPAVLREGPVTAGQA
jgi:hypothetical protein